MPARAGNTGVKQGIRVRALDSRKMLYASGDPAEAEAIRHHLEARGVAAVVEPVPAQDRTGGCPGNVYEINLVCEEDLSRGREALLEFFEQALRPVLSEVEQPSPRLDRSLLAEVTIVGLVGWLASVYGAVAFYVWPEAPEEHFWHST